MKKEQIRELIEEGRISTPLEQKVIIPVAADIVCPRPEDALAHCQVLKPNDPKNYNQLSVVDMEAFHELHQMDRFHMQDAAAMQYYKGVASKMEYKNPQTQEALQKRSLLNDIVQRVKSQKQ